MSIADISQFSSLVSVIYDCALDPDRWPAALEKIKDFREASVTGITVVDPVARRLRSSFSVGLSADAERQLNETYDALLPAPLFDSSGMVLDEVYCVADKMDRRDFETSRFFREWAEPNGIFDSPSSCLMKGPARFAMATCMMPRVATERDRQLGRLLAPHIRRAVVISDLLNSSKIEVEHFEKALDALTIGVVITDDQANIQFANQIADAMLVAGNPIQSSNGVLKTQSPAATHALWTSISQMARQDAAPEIVGIGIPASGISGGMSAVMHVLPLERRSGGALAGRQRIAVFIGPVRLRSETAMEIMAAVYGLTRAETQVLKRIGQGEMCEEIARSANVAVSTIRTHLSRLIAKTGVRRQAELVLLVGHFSLPVQWQGSGRKSFAADMSAIELLQS